MVSQAGIVPVVAIVGRPNVGKSTLFNRIIGERAAIVEDRARTTRDRLYADTEWNGRRFILVDTGGLEVDPDDPIEAKVQVQARLAIAEADRHRLRRRRHLRPEPGRPGRRRAAAAGQGASVRRRQQGRQPSPRARCRGVLVARLGAHVPDRGEPRPGRGGSPRRDRPGVATRDRRGDCPQGRERDSRRVREGRPDGASAVHRRRGRRGWRRRGRAPKPQRKPPTPRSSRREAEAARWDAMLAADNDEPPAIAFVGRPNVGKSSLLNALLGEERMIVSDIPGTTRDAIDTRVAWGRTEVVLIDTAGIRKRGKVASSGAAERYSALRSLKAISRADVAVLLIDGVDGLTAQDAHIAGYVVEEGKGLVIAINKWDAVEDKKGKTFDTYVEWIRAEAPFLDFAPVVSISAKTGQRVGRVLEMAVDVWAERRRRIGTGELNRLVSAAIGAPAGADGQGPAAEDLLRHPGGRRAADVRLLRPQRGLGPLQLQALSREPHPRDLRLPRGADPARVPRAGRDPRRGQGHPASRSRGRGLEAEPMTDGAPRVAVVGSGAWGTTLSRSLWRGRSRSRSVPFRRDRGAADGPSDATSAGCRASTCPIASSRRRIRRPSRAPTW